MSAMDWFPIGKDMFEKKKEMAVSISYKLYIKAENSYAYFDEIRWTAKCISLFFLQQINVDVCSKKYIV